MKVLHVVGGDLTGGAARGAYWLHNALNKDGVESKLIVSRASKINDSNVIEIEQSKVDKLKNRIRSQLDQMLFRGWMNGCPNSKINNKLYSELVREIFQYKFLEFFQHRAKNRNLERKDRLYIIFLSWLDKNKSNLQKLS